MKSKSPASIKWLCLDLGGIIVDVQWQRTLDGLGLQLTLDQALEQVAHWDIFHSFEKGQITAEEFHQAMQQKFALPSLTFQAFTRGWNACLAGTLPDVEKVLAELPQDLPVVALSNTNPVHIQHVQDWPVFQRFQKILVSHEMGERKPAQAIYQQATKHMGRPEEILFIDDLIDNCQAARSVGWHAEQSVSSAARMREIFVQYGLVR